MDSISELNPRRETCDTPREQPTHTSILSCAQTNGNVAAWSFLDALAASSGDDASTAEEVYVRVENAAAKQLPPRAHAVLRWALAARIMSPRAAAHAAAARSALARFGPNVAATASALNAFAIRIDADRSAHLLKDDNNEIANAIDAADLASATPTDHVMDAGCETSKTTFIVYADTATSSFAKLHAVGVRGARNCQFRYVLRHWRSPASSISETTVSLQGFAVHAAVKATEYRVVDDRVYSHKLFPDAPHGGIGTSVDAVDGVVDIKQFETRSVGLAVAEHVRRAAVAAQGNSVSAALNTLQRIVDDAPVELASVNDKSYSLSTRLHHEVIQLSDVLRSQVGRGDALFINGRALQVSSAVAQSLPSTLRCLACLSGAAAALESMGAPPAEVASLLHSSGNSADDNALKLRLQLVGAEDLTVWYNDLTKDSRYHDWDQFSNDSYIRSVHSKHEDDDASKLVKVRANLLSLVIALDPGDPQQMPFLSLLEQIVHAELPLHAGVILVPNDKVSTMVVAAFHYLRLGRGKKAAVGFIRTINQILEYFGSGFQQIQLSPQIVETAFRQSQDSGRGDNDAFDYPTIDSIIERHEKVKDLLKTAREWANSNGLFAGSGEKKEAAGGDDGNATVPRSFSMIGTINGILLKNVAADTLPTAVKEQNRIAKILNTEDTSHIDREAEPDAPSWTMLDSSLMVVKRVSRSLLSQQPRDLISGKVKESKRLSFTQLHQLKNEWTNLDDYDQQKLGNVQGKVEGAVTLWLTTCRRSSLKFAKSKDILQQFASSSFAKRNNVRIGIIPHDNQIAQQLVVCKDDEELSSDHVFVVNGRILAADEIISTDDLEAEVAIEYLSKASKFGARQDASVNSWDAAILASAAIRDVDAACSGAPNGADGPRADALESLLKAADKMEEVSSFVFPSSEKIRDAARTHPMTVVAVCDPLGDHSSATVAFLTAVGKAFGDSVFTGLILVPHVGAREEVPKSRQVFSRFLLSPVPKFQNGHLMQPNVVFNKLPQDHILTFDVKQPRSWFIASYATNYDMDNVILNSLADNVSTLYAEYELQSLLVEGSCVDETGSAPQGLQVKMSSPGRNSVDTLVMANLGYFQLRVPVPGQWAFSLAKGRSSDIFDIKSIDSRLSAMYGTSGASAHTFSSSDSGSIEVFVDSLDGACGTLLKVARKQGKEGQTVLNGNRDSRLGGKIMQAKSAMQKMVSMVSGMFDKVIGGLKEDEKPETINVFSVASGHLYERFLKIMMLSVSKHASRPVKFWLLENYLSPAFKKMLPHFAKERGFEVGLVTYRWPGWLREQSEKQRIIWAYKILYLDVLFPLNVRRIIFVDSDQVVRADLAELMDMDLHGAPYGYTPFCDSRKDVDGYRFWKTGFWKNTLGDLKYHISALYVVDLQRLRDTASGDKLRAMYQSLSADPNSLSNLDQDLPNYAAAVPGASGASVPIFDLPQEWLWCESWCDDESKKSAKTIDLCNNPKTKEPKLVSAKRIIGEWESLDNEAGEATDRIYAELVGNENANIEKMTSADNSKNKVTTSADDSNDEL